ncbi:probable calcium-binding CML23 [Olea europaea subsp. europaea]|uniref:Probable calcium-binding CML23 n=1 Tax=Olea europaea subsp. europaea TaxID=158383 RepID=A0A8S0VK04_OLEEU|nr:probable calcium-binding CML23 [Olea europaea subsp. europaea]
MLDSLSTCLNSQNKRARKFIAKLNFLKKFTSWKRRKPKRLVSDLSWLTSSFAAMELSNQLEQVFKFIDTNGDGKLSSYELEDVLLNLGNDKKVANKEAEEMVREMDSNGDGFVDLQEFLNAMELDNDAIGIDIMEAFRVFDADKNGLISAEDLQRVFKCLGCGKCSLRDCHSMIKGVDKDGDGFVNFEDFKLMMSAGCKI